jgi:hypothetical protein
MSEISDPAELVGRAADERLLEEEAVNLPAAIGRPDSLPAPGRVRARLVGTGATLTGVTLILGVALVALGIVEAVGGSATLAVVATAVGICLAGTHWGWVHVAEATADAIEERRTGAARDRRKLWLATVKPYTRYEVTTSVDDDGAIRISRARYLPVPRGQAEFTFARVLELEEVHPADEPGASVTERAELLRRQAAADTERERERFEAAADAYETALLSRESEAQARAASRAASEALSAQINANLREPPLVE